MKKSDFEESSEEEELQRKQRGKKMEQEKERVRWTEERKESRMETVKDLKELWSALSLKDEERVELHYLRQKFRKFLHKTSSEEEERDDAEMERKQQKKE
ncbi:convicilin-like isoform X2 [Colossoma macropomum]|uniref:convicilin-like isoform X2 n=1 Tax=Colossoma macropomum TaxID=42526 RepID=UPI001865022D|nr:convicilin-like isoform X2 [Colossoma macropomum]